MKLFILIGCLLSIVLAEPPVQDSYAAAARDNDNSDYQGSLSQEYRAPTSKGVGYPRNSITQEYGVPSNKAGQISQKYGAPEAKSGQLSQEYGAPDFVNTEPNLPSSRSGLHSQYKGLSPLSTSVFQGYVSPKARTNVLSIKYGIPYARNSKTSQKYPSANLRKSISEEYGAPEFDARTASEGYSDSSYSGLSQEYGVPNVNAGSDYDTASLRNSPSESYGPPSQHSSPSSQYGVPELHSRDYNVDEGNYALTQDYSVPSRQTPSQNYGAPGIRSHKFLSRNPSKAYGTPTLRSSSLSTDYSAPENSITNNFNSKGISQSYNPLTSSSVTYSAPLSSQYESPIFNSRKSYSQRSSSPSQSYGAPTQRSLSETYGVPSTKGLSEEYGAPLASSLNLKTSARVSSFARSPALTQKYGAPAVRDNMPSDLYGVPEQYTELSNQGYSYARSNLDELLNQDPAHYDFAYKVNDYESGSDFGHSEIRQENRAEGSYFVVLPDGSKQVVEYEADESGFKPRISVEPAAEGGYDNNASDLTRNGPYP